MIHINKSPFGRIANVVFGFASIADGLVRVLSAGFLHGNFSLDLARRQSRRHFAKLKKGLK